MLDTSQGDIPVNAEFLDEFLRALLETSGTRVAIGSFSDSLTVTSFFDQEAQVTEALSNLRTENGDSQLVSSLISGLDLLFNQASTTHFVVFSVTEATDIASAQDLLSDPRWRMSRSSFVSLGLDQREDLEMLVTDLQDVWLAPASSESQLLQSLTDDVVSTCASEQRGLFWCICDILTRVSLLLCINHG